MASDDCECGSEHINCRECGEETNHVPDFLPSDWDGFCPKCAIEKMLTGDLTKIPSELFIDILTQQLVGIGVVVVSGKQTEGWEQVGSDEQSASFIVTQCLN